LNQTLADIAAAVARRYANLVDVFVVAPAGAPSGLALLIDATRALQTAFRIEAPSVLLRPDGYIGTRAAGHRTIRRTSTRIVVVGHRRIRAGHEGHEGHEEIPRGLRVLVGPPWPHPAARGAARIGKRHTAPTYRRRRA
jgi:hypothetical protein